MKRWANKRRKTTHIRVPIDTLKAIREAMPRFEKDPDRIEELWRLSPYRVERWLGLPVKRKRR